MTIEDLQELFYLDKLIDFENERLENLRAKLDLHSPTISDMPKASGARDKIGDIMPEIVDKTRELETDIQDLEERRQRLQEFIRVIPNIRIRIIMSRRFIDQMTWTEVAAKIGGRETEDTVKKAVYRYLESKRQSLGA